MRNRFLRLLALLPILIPSSGCREPSEQQTLLLAREVVSFRKGRTGFSMIGQTFVGEWESDPVELRGNYTLEFLPILAGASRVADFRTLVRVGKKDQEVGVVQAVPQSAISRRPGQALKMVRIDLSAFEGHEIQVVFRLADATGDLPGVVGIPRLRSQSDRLDRPPDVLMICSDTLRWDTSVGERGAQLMPALNRMRGNAVSYQNAFSAASWTMPSIATAMTGLYPRYHGTGERALSHEPEPPPGHFTFKSKDGLSFLRTFPKGLQTLPERLLEAGYSTRMAASNPLYFLSGLARDGFEIALDASVSLGVRVNHLARGLIRSADPDIPLFLLVHYMDAHEWGDRYVELSRGDTDRANDPEGVREAYDSAVREGDRVLGALLDVWTRLRGDETLIVFWSDHGEHLLENDLLGHGNSMSDLLLRVPLVVSYPSGLGKREGSELESVSLADLAPTVLDAVGVGYDPASLSGESLLRPTDSRERVHFADYQLYGKELASVRQGEYKLVIDLESGQSELWQLRGEDSEIRVENSRLAEELSRAYQSYLSSALEARQDLELPEIVDDDEALEALKELGYVQ